MADDATGHSILAQAILRQLNGLGQANTDDIARAISRFLSTSIAIPRDQQAYDVASNELTFALYKLPPEIVIRLTAWFVEIQCHLEIAIAAKEAAVDDNALAGMIELLSIK